MGKEIVKQVQEVQRISYRRNPRRNTSRHILIKLKIKLQGRILKKKSQEKVTSDIQSKTHTIDNGSLSRNSAGQKGMAGYI